MRVVLVYNIYKMWKEISRETHLVIWWDITTCIWEFKTKDMVIEVEFRKAKRIQAFVRKKWCYETFFNCNFNEDMNMEYAIKVVDEYLNDNFKIIE